MQNDIKRVIAYSTCSQLGYMFVALGAGAYSVGIFHLFTHGFFKALLFLGAGSVIHAMHHEQDMRHMGGLWRKIPFTYATMLIGGLALTGFPFTAGYFSKDAIIESAFTSHSPVASYAFIIDGGGGGADLVLLLAADVHDLPWPSARPPSPYEHAHESPLDHDWCRSACSPSARCWRAMFLFPYFVGHDVEQFFREAIFMSPENKILEEMHHHPGLVPSGRRR